MRGRLAARRVIVTGAASGIGRAVAELFHEEGARLALIDRDADGVNDAARALDALPLTLDLEQADEIDATVERAAVELGGLDGLVNCAGIGVPTSIADTDRALLQRFAAINLFAPYLLCRAALPHLRQASVATIVNISSGQALLPNAPNNTAYAATKGGLIVFTKSLAIEAAPHVRANVVCPGMTRTPMTQFLFDQYDDLNAAPFLQSYALRRVGEPEEIARAVLFLTSDESSFITGSALAVDGGRCFH